MGLDLLNAGRELIEEGYLELHDDFLMCTRKGIVLSNSVNVRIFQNLGL
jgi:coproporphyrinogen III oxidase-like Fe-S oxidoreductase